MASGIYDVKLEVKSGELIILFSTRVRTALDIPFSKSVLTFSIGKYLPGQEVLLNLLCSTISNSFLILFLCNLILSLNDLNCASVIFKSDFPVYTP